jgi:ABC-type polysaccharide/polyol phosphate export permease
MNVHNIASQPAAPVAENLSAAALPKAVPPAVASSAGRVVAEEMIAGFRAWPIWMTMGWDDVRQRYRRSIIGPFWITLSMGVFILVLSIIYSRLFRMELHTYMPYLSVGIIVWGFIAQATNESCVAFHESARIIKQIKLPYSVYVLRVLWRNFIVFLHTIVIFVPVAIVFGVVPSLATFCVIPGLALLCINQFWVGIVLAVLSTRYRDMVPIVQTGVQIMMFATPIMWPVSALNGAMLIADVNPLYHLIELVRAPALGEAPAALSWLVAIGLAVAGNAVAAALVAAKSRRVVFWL